MFFLSNWFRRLSRPARSVTRAARPARPALEALEDRVTPTVALNLVVPPSSSYGVDNSLVIDYSNTGTTNVAAPVVILSATNANVWLPSDPAITGTSLQLLATSPTGAAGTLTPGAQGSIVVDYTATSSSASAVNFSLGQLTSGQTINWSSLESSLQPSTIPANAWPAVFANFTANVGNTTDAYQATLDADATYLGQLGEPTNDVARLLAYEINKANATFSTTPLGDTVDAALPTPGGLSLSFERWFQPGVAARYQTGTLGLGWTNNWAITASTDSSGDVTVNESGSLRYFSLQSDGTYLGSWGDDGVLTKRSSGGYQLTELDGSSTVFNANGTLDYVQDSNGNRITATYNANGLLSQLTASNGEYLTLTYTNGLLTKLTDSTGETTTYAYDSTGQYLLGTTDEYGATTYTYVSGQGAAAQNALASITDAEGTTTVFGYDAEGRLVDEHQNNDQQDVKFSYGAAGGVTTTDADGNTSTVLEDDNGQVCETIDALGNITHYTYDISGDLTAVNGPQGANYTFTYDTNGNLLSETDPLGLTTQFTYNANNDLTSYTDAKGNTTSYTYDNSNDLLSVTYANGTQEKDTYNPLGEATQFVDANGVAINSSYNTQGLVSEESFTDGTSYTYTYDVHGNLLKATSSAGTITFAYQDSANPDLLTEVLYPNGQYLKFTYNTIGQRTQSVDQTGFTVNYVYDALGRLQELTDGSGNLIASYTYDAAGNVVQQDNGNGTFTVYTYDGDGDVLSITNNAPSTGATAYTAANSAVNSFDAYTYDALGNVLTDTNQDGKWVYTYDADSQLTQAVFTPNSTDPDGLTSQILQYSYDAAGNRVAQTVNGVTTTYVVNNVNEYTSSTTNGVTTTYQYDNDGNLISQTTAGVKTTYSYDELDDLTGVSGPGLTATYTYDPLGNRSSQTVNGATTQFLNDPLTGIASTYNGSGSLIAHFTSGPGLVSQVSVSGAVGYYDFDLTGNTIGITGAAGSYVNTYSYLPFGQTTTITATLANPFTFVGEFGVMQDSTTLSSMGAREYSATTGQFLSNDPTGLGGGDANIRRYAGNTPTTAIDPAGTQDFSFGSPDSMTAGQLQQLNEQRPQRPQSQPDLGVRLMDLGTGGQYSKAANAMGRAVVNHMMPDSNSSQPMKHPRTTTGKGGIRVSPGNTAGAKTNGNPYAANHRPAGFLLQQVIRSPQKKKARKSTKQNNPQQTTTYDPNLAPLDVAIDLVDTLVTPGASGSTDNTQPVAASNVVAGVFVSIYAFYFSDYAPGVTATDFQATASYTDDHAATLTDTPTCEVVTAPNSAGSSGNFAVLVLTTFVAAGSWGGTIDVSGAGLTWTDTSALVMVQQAPLALSGATVSIPANGILSGVIATFRNTDPTASQDTYSVNVGTPAQMSVVSAYVQPGPGGIYQVVADLNFGAVPQADTTLDVTVTASNPINNTVGNYTWSGDVTSNASYATAGATPVTAAVTSPVLQVSAGNAAVADLATVITTASGLTPDMVSATSSDPGVVVTGDTVTPMAGGGDQITLQGIINAVNPGNGTAIAPLAIHINGQPSLSAQVEYQSTASDFTVNPIAVPAVAGQPLQNVPVGSLTGPLSATTTGVVSWGDGETSPAVFTPLGGDLFRVTASKPQPYATSGSYTVTVTVTDPADLPAPPAATTTATVTPGLPFSDPFAGSQLSTGNWITQVGSFTVASNTVTGTAGLDLATLNGVQASNVAVQATIALTAGQYAGLVADYSGPGDQNYCVGGVAATATGYQAYLYRNVNGAFTLLSLQSCSSAPSGVLRLEVFGPSLKLFLGGTLVAYADDTTLTSGSVGMRVTAGATMSNFSATALTATTPTLPFTDGFTTATSPGTGQLTSNWINQAGNVAVTSASGTATGAGGYDLATLVGVDVNNVAVQATVGTLGVNQYAALVADYSGPGDQNYYSAGITNTGSGDEAFIAINLEGGAYLLDEVAVPTSASGALLFEVSDAALRLFQGTTLIASANNSTLTSGSVGLRTIGAGVTLSAFSATALTVTPASLPFTDTFTTPTTPTGQLTSSWTTQAGSFTVNTTTGTATGAAGYAFATLVGVHTGNVAVQATVDTLGVNQYAALIANYSGPGDQNYYDAGVTNTGSGYEAFIYLNLEGAAYPLFLGSYSGQATGVLRFQEYGPSLQLFLGSTLIGYAGNGTLTGGSVGLRTIGAGVSLSAFSATALTVTPASLPFTDGFTATTTPPGQLSGFWVNQSGAFAVTTSTGKATALAGSNLATLTGLSVANVTVQATVSVTGQYQFAGLISRYAGPGDQNYYEAGLYNTGSGVLAVLYRNVAQQYTLLASAAVSVTGGTLEFVTCGTSLNLYLNGTLVLSAGDEALPGSGGVGMRATVGASVSAFSASVPASGLPFSDSFSGSQLSSSWVTQAGSFTEASGHATGVGGYDLATVVGVEAGTVVVQATVGTLGVNQYAALVADYGGPGDANYYSAGITNTGSGLEAFIAININGGAYLLEEASVPTSASGMLQFDVSGSSLELYLGTTVIASASNSTLTGGSVGIRTIGAGVSLSGFSAST